MKKLTVLAALAFAAATAATAADTDSYLYWMVELDANVESSYSSYVQFNYATIKAKNADGTTSDYLSLYGTDSSESLGTRLYASSTSGDDKMTTGGGTFAGVGDYGADSSFLVELWMDTGSADDASATRVAYASFAYSEALSHIYDGMSQSGASPYVVSQVQAVPEPTGGLLTLLGVAVLALRRKRVIG